MKKLYLIFGNISGMGGGQMYIANKVEYLKHNDWAVDVYNIGEGDILIDSLKVFKENRFPEEGQEFFVFSRKRYRNYLEDFERKYKDEYEKIVIESDIGQTSIWGEKVAETLGAKHVIFSLPDLYGRYHNWYYEFLWFKYTRNELAGIHPRSMKELFKPYKHLSDDTRHALKFSNNCTFEECENDILDCFEKKDICLCSISRLEKGYIFPMLDAIVSVAIKHKDRVFQIILVGDTKQKKLKDEIVGYGNKVTNVRIIMLGNLSPVPKKLLELTDYFIGTAGAVMASAVNGKISICVTTDKGLPVGIVGLDTVDTLSNKVMSVSLADYLERIIICEKKEHIESLINIDCLLNDFMKEYDNHMKFIDETEVEKKYYAFKIGLPLKIIYRIIEIIGFQRIRKIKNFIKGDKN